MTKATNDQIDWDEYARTQLHRPNDYAVDPPHMDRLIKMAERCGPTEWSVLDVGCSDGYGTFLIKEKGHEVHGVDLSPERVQRLQQQYNISGTVASADNLPFEDDSFDVVCMGEIMEHTDNPGACMAEAVRIARQRVVISIPLNGWADPTHLWGISIDMLGSMNPIEKTKGEAAVITWQAGRCWPRDYWVDNHLWEQQHLLGQ